MRLEVLFKRGEFMSRQSPIREGCKPTYFKMCEDSRKAIMTTGPVTPKN